MAGFTSSSPTLPVYLRLRESTASARLEWSALLSEAMAYFGSPYPRERSVRLKRLPRADGRERAAWDPFAGLDDKFYGSADAERLRWDTAADSYAVAAA
jgi:hypothetical protein